MHMQSPSTMIFMHLLASLRDLALNLLKDAFNMLVQIVSGALCLLKDAYNVTHELGDFEVKSVTENEGAPDSSCLRC